MNREQSSKFGKLRAGDVTAQIIRAGDIDFKAVTSSSSDRAILIWKFEDAPKKYQVLSQNGGDEDYIALIPNGMEIPVFLEEGTAFGCFKVEKHEVAEGLVLIGCHA